MNAHDRLQRAKLRKRLKLTATAFAGAVLLLLLSIRAFTHQTSFAASELDRQSRFEQWNDEVDEILQSLANAETTRAISSRRRTGAVSSCT